MCNGKEAMTIDYKKFGNNFGDRQFLVKTQKTDSLKLISFDWDCDNNKRQWAQQTFLKQSHIIHDQRGEPILVTSLTSAHNASMTLKRICEYWEKYHPTKPLWNWSRHDIMQLLRANLIKTPKAIDGVSFYSYQTLSTLTSAVNKAHKGKLLGQINDSFSMDITVKLKKEAAEPILTKYGITYGEWMKGISIPAVPFSIASFLLARSISILEAEKTRIAVCVYTAWRTNPSTDIIDWFRRADNSGDIIERCNQDSSHRQALITALNDANLGHLKRLPWATAGELTAWCNHVSTAGLITLFIQSGHRYAEVLSARSNERGRVGKVALIYETLDKSLGGLRVLRPIPRLSETAVDTLWNLSFIDPRQHPLPLAHRAGLLPTCRSIVTSHLESNWVEANTGFEYQTLTARINKFYHEEVLAFVPAAQQIHPKITFHQFRHSYAEFALRRFDEGVHEKLREHFFHQDSHTTQIYELKKLDDEVRAIVEKGYLFELIGKIGDGLLEGRFWGPAYSRLKNEVEKLKILHLGDWQEYAHDLVANIERIAAFEWGYCVLFSSSKVDAKCHDPVTGLPEVEGSASAGRCVYCPNNMGNSIQKGNLIRIAIAHSDVASRHPIKAIGKLSEDIAEQISRRIGAR